MSHLNPATGLWEDDANGPAPPQPGSLGQQVDTPQTAPPVFGPPDLLPASPPPTAPAPAPIPAPATPAVTPYVPPAMPAIPPSRVVSPAESQTLAQQGGNEQARATSATQEGQLAHDKAFEVAGQAYRDEQERVAHAQAQQQILDDAAKRTAELQAAKKQQYDEYRQMGLKDPEADQSFGHKLLAAIAIGLGEYSSKMNGGPNRAAELIQQANAQNIALQKAAIEKKFKEYQAAGGDIQEALAERNDALQKLNLKHAALLEASAAKLKTELSRMGIPQAQVDANQAVQTVEQDALAKRESVNQDIAKRELEQAKIDAAKLAAAAKAKKAAAAGGGGGEHSAALQEIIDGASPAEVQAKYKIPDKVLGNLVKTAAGSQKTGIGAAGENNPLAIRRSDGTVAGLTSSVRNVKQVQDRMVNYEDAIHSLEELKASGDRIPIGSPAYNRALLAVAAVTTNNITDKTTEHEAATIKQYGIVSQDAIDKTLEHIQRRQAAFEKQLRPIKATAPAGQAAAPSTPAAPDMAGAAARVRDDPKAPPATRARAIKWLREHQNDTGDITL